MGVALCALQWTGQKSETFIDIYAVSDRVAGDCKVLIVLCICILFAKEEKIPNKATSQVFVKLNPRQKLNYDTILRKMVEEYKIFGP